MAPGLMHVYPLLPVPEARAANASTSVEFCTPGNLSTLRLSATVGAGVVHTKRGRCSRRVCVAPAGA